MKRARNSKPAVNTPTLSTTRAQICDIVGLLENFEEATDSLQGDGITISMIIPAIRGIDSLLAAQKTQYVTFQLQLRSALQRRFDDILRMPEYFLATLLDPIYKMVPIMRTADDDSNDNEPLANSSTSSRRRQQALTLVSVVSSTEARTILLQQIRALGLRELTASTPSTTSQFLSDSVQETSDTAATPAGKEEHIFKVSYPVSSSRTE